MPKSEEELQKHTLNLFRGDYEELQSMYPDVGAGPVIRRVIRSYIKRAKEGLDNENPSVRIEL